MRSAGKPLDGFDKLTASTLGALSLSKRWRPYIDCMRPTMTRPRRSLRFACLSYVRNARQRMRSGYSITALPFSTG